MSLWKVGRVDTGLLEPEQLAEVLAWLVGLDVDTKTVVPKLAVSQDSADESYRLHLSQFVYDDDGSKVVDYAVNRMFTKPLVLPITEFPAWLPAVSHQQANGDA